MDEWEIVDIEDKIGWVDFTLKSKTNGITVFYCKNVKEPMMGEVMSVGHKFGKMISVEAEYLEKAGVDIPALRAMAMMMREWG